MDDALIERAVEAAAKADYEVLRRGHWDEQPDDFRDEWRSDVRPLVTAALAEVEASITAERDELRRWKEEALPVLSDLQNLGRALDVPLGELAARVARVEALAEAWRYKGEFGYDDGSHAYGPDPESAALDDAAHELLKTIRGESE